MFIRNIKRNRERVNKRNKNNCKRSRETGRRPTGGRRKLGSGLSIRAMPWANSRTIYKTAIKNMNKDNENKSM